MKKGSAGTPQFFEHLDCETTAYPKAPGREQVTSETSVDLVVPHQSPAQGLATSP